MGEVFTILGQPTILDNMNMYAYKGTGGAGGGVTYGEDGRQMTGHV